jgi:hypothetical protein
MLASLPEDDSGNEENDSVVCEPGEMTEEWDASIDQDGKLAHANADNPRVEGEEETLTGVLVGRCIRGFYTTLNVIVVGDNPLVAPIDDEKDHYHVLVRIQYNDACNSVPATTIKELRSYWRRYCKNGDLLHIRRGTFQDAQEIERSESGTPAGAEMEEAWREPRFVVHVRSVNDAQRLVQLQQERFFAVSQCQAWQERLYRCQLKRQNRREAKPKDKQQSREDEASCNAHHSGGLEKRQQGEFVANFLLHMIMASIGNTASNGTNGNNSNHQNQSFLEDRSTWSSPSSLQADSLLDRRKAALDYLNGGSGVLDVAGGSGHVSMALGMLGVQSTVVDPRETVGSLPGRDRKMWNRALKRLQNPENGKEQEPSVSEKDSSTSTSPMTMICQPVRPFQTLRAWFGTPPPGIHPHYRNPHSATVPVVCDDNHEIVRNCRAIVALHPDEATDAIVDLAVTKKIPLVIVPCCVFGRLFQHRRMPNGAMVSTHQDLLVYLQAKDASIQKGTLPFVGANTVLYRPLQSGMLE